MILPVQERVRAHVTRVLAGLYSLDQTDAGMVVLEYPPSENSATSVRRSRLN